MRARVRVGIKPKHELSTEQRSRSRCASVRGRRRGATVGTACGQALRRSAPERAVLIRDLHANAKTVIVVDFNGAAQA